MLRHVLKTSESTRDIVQEAASKAIDSKALAAAVAGGTAALSITEIQSYAQLFATFAAGVLSVTLFIKHAYDIYRAYKKAKAEDEEQS